MPDSRSVAVMEYLTDTEKIKQICSDSPPVIGPVISPTIITDTTSKAPTIINDTTSTAVKPVKKNQRKVSVPVIKSSRVGGRVIRAPVLFDPSYEGTGKRRKKDTDQQNGNEQLPKKIRKPVTDGRRKYGYTSESCVICSTRYVKVHDKLLVCKRCPYRAHLNCLKRRYDNVCEDENNWQCNECRVCAICYQTAIDDPLYKCKVCSNSYHAECNDPDSFLRNHTTANFVCKGCIHFDKEFESFMTPEIQLKSCNPINSFDQCLLGRSSTQQQSCIGKTNELGGSSNRNLLYPGLTNNQINHITNNNSTTYNRNDLQSTVLPSFTASKGTATESEVIDVIKIESDDDEISTTSNSTTDNFNLVLLKIVRNAQKWAVDDVYNYFLEYFSHDVANIFKEQEIDGRSLLLMRRSDVINGLSIKKLGTSLKVYAHIVMLQTSKNDPRLSWS